MTFRQSLAAVAAVAFFAGSAMAQGTVQVKVTSTSVPGGTPVKWDPPGATYGPLYVSPYTGVIMTSNQTVVLNCVDFFHVAKLNTAYYANVTSLSSASLSNTRFNNLEWYLQAAWLTTQYSSPNPGDKPNQTIAIQAAIWNIFTPAAPDKQATSNTSKADQDYWLAAAAANWRSVNAADFYVLTPTNKDAANSFQEFLVYNPSPVPEPATLTLLATGMAGLGLAARRRRRKGAA